MQKFLVFETINSEAGRADDSDFGFGLLVEAVPLRTHELPFKYKNIISKPKKADDDNRNRNLKFGRLAL